MPNQTSTQHIVRRQEHGVGQAEPPSPASRADTPLFMIGKDSHGRWVVRDQRGLRGGLFVDRMSALRFALFENGNRPQAVVMVPGVFELDMGEEPAAH